MITAMHFLFQRYMYYINDGTHGSFHFYHLLGSKSSPKPLTVGRPECCVVVMTSDCQTSYFGDEPIKSG